MPNLYKHKEISTLPPDSNILLTKAKNAYDRLKMVYDNQIPYVADDYSDLILTFERFYKGVFIELNKMDENKMSDKEINSLIHANGHYFTALIQRVNKYIPVSSTCEGYQMILDHCHELQKRYTKARFDIDYDIEEFRKDFRRLEAGMSRITKGLSELYEKSKNEEMDKDLEYW